MSDPNDTSARQSDFKGTQSTGGTHQKLYGRKLKLPKNMAKSCKGYAKQVNANHGEIQRLAKSNQYLSKKLWGIVHEEFPETEGYELTFDHKRTVTVLMKSKTVI